MVGFCPIVLNLWFLLLMVVLSSLTSNSRSFDTARLPRPLPTAELRDLAFSFLIHLVSALLQKREMSAKKGQVDLLRLNLKKLLISRFSKP